MHLNKGLLGNRQIRSWALYDFANSAFATTVMAGFFPLFFKQYWSGGVDATVSTSRLGVASAAASALILILAPLLGALADAGSYRKRLLGFFALLGVLSTGSLFFIAQGEWLWALIALVLGLVGFSGANIFYDSLLPTVATAEQLDTVSALGFSLGYLGGGLLFMLDVLLLLKPHWFGIADTATAVRLAFVSVAIWWLVFSLPLMLQVRESGNRQIIGLLASGKLAWRRLRGTFSELRKLKTVMTFLIAYWLYIDAVDTIVRMAVDYGLSIGLQSNGLMLALLITQFVSFPAALGFGILGDRIGPKAGILIGLSVYIAASIWAAFIQYSWEFYALAATIGLVQGGVQSLSRSLYARLVPANRPAEYFGFYNMLGKFAAIFGPLLIALTGSLTANPRLAMSSIVILLLAGMLLLWRVDTNEGIRQAQLIQ